MSSVLLHRRLPFQQAWHPSHSSIFISARRIVSIRAPASRAPWSTRDTITSVFPFFRGLPTTPSTFFMVLISSSSHENHPCAASGVARPSLVDDCIGHLAHEERRTFPTSFFHSIVVGCPGSRNNS